MEGPWARTWLATSQIKEEMIKTKRWQSVGRSTHCHNTCVQLNYVTFCWQFSAVPGVSKWRAPAGEIPERQCSSRHFVQHVSVTKTHNCASGSVSSEITWRVQITLGNMCQKGSAFCEFHARTINTFRWVPQKVLFTAVNSIWANSWCSATFEVLTAVLLKIRFSGMWCCVAGWVPPDVSDDRRFFSYMVKHLTVYTLKCLTL